MSSENVTGRSREGSDCSLYQGYVYLVQEKSGSNTKSESQLTSCPSPLLFLPAGAQQFDEPQTSKQNVYITGIKCTPSQSNNLTQFQMQTKEEKSTSPPQSTPTNPPHTFHPHTQPLHLLSIHNPSPIKDPFRFLQMIRDSRPV